MALSDSRIITPVFAHGSVPGTLTTRATMSTSPVQGWYTKWNESAVSQMSVPDAKMVKVDPDTPALPATPTLPMSRCSHGFGSTIVVDVVVVARLLVVDTLVLLELLEEVELLDDELGVVVVAVVVVLVAVVVVVGDVKYAV